MIISSECNQIFQIPFGLYWISPCQNLMPYTYNTERMILYLLKDCDKLERGLDKKMIWC